MARPRKDSPGPSAEERLQAAFWELIEEQPLERMTVGDLTARAGCNRGTFYYYYDDMYEMLDAMIDRNLPKQLPSFLLQHFTGEAPSADHDRELAVALRTFQPMIDRLCLLLANASSPLVTRRVKGAVMELWAGEFAAGGEAALAGDARIVLEFVVSGILGLMAYRAETGMRVSVEEIAQVLAPALPDALAPILKRILEADAAPA
ncbi:TetR family transcriptional regulator [Eggerthella guodeyinii]|uniref:TetR family transcriptional regulator n=1 Tax=Eggerthella guodeyinii TaxID=2690837 RepID=A0A6L7INP4_9ACTN|nr:TetR family transcriptional regulator [Eggerthella guodeyinii]QOS67664.1 TetR family transcriptional regulator [Eggerthella guodeyinii]